MCFLNFAEHCQWHLLRSAETGSNENHDSTAHRPPHRVCETSRSIISHAWLHLLPGVHLQAINQVVFLGSSVAVQLGRVILGAASRLDAFSAYPFLT